MVPQFPPVLPLMVCLLALFLFGWGFNAFVGWVNKRKVWPVSFSVVIGVLVTLLVPTVTFLHESLTMWQAGLVYLACFTASGIPMIAGNVYRQTNGHKAHRLPNRVLRVREDVVGELNLTIQKIVKKEAEVVDVVHTLHQVIGSLKSL